MAPADIDTSISLLRKALAKTPDPKIEESFWRVTLKGCEFTLFAAANSPQLKNLDATKKAIADTLRQLAGNIQSDTLKSLVNEYIKSISENTAVEKEKLLKEAEQGAKEIDDKDTRAKVEKIIVILKNEKPNEEQSQEIINFLKELPKTLNKPQSGSLDPVVNVVANLLPVAIPMLKNAIKPGDLKKIKELRDAIRIGVGAVMAVQMALSIKTAGLKAAIMAILADLLKFLDLGIALLTAGANLPRVAPAMGKTRKTAEAAQTCPIHSQKKLQKLHQAWPRRLKK